MWVLQGKDGVMPDKLYTPAEVARMFRVDPATITRWADAGKLPSLRTLGGHRRFRAADVEAAMARAEKDHGAA